MKLFFAILFLTITHSTFAQFGVSGAWQSFRADDWHQFENSQNGSTTSAATGYAASVNYWFRLKEKRVEFLPELSYGRHELAVDAGKFKHQTLSFFFNVNIYPFDFGSDCNCPTWSKTGNFFTKGFYLQFTIGGSFFRNTLSTPLNKFDDKSMAVISHSG